MSQSSKNILYPDLRAKLLKIAHEDQKTRKSLNFHKQQSTNSILKSDNRRAEEVMAILEIIKTPSVKNVGLDGSRAIWLIAQHNADYKDLGDNVLKKMTKLYQKDKKQVYYQGIPFLIDRLMIFKQLSKGVAAEKAHEINLHIKQLYGTQFWINPSGKKVRFTVIKPVDLQARRQEFGLAELDSGLL